MSVNKVILVGRLGQNPEIRYTAGGAPVANFSVATQENWMDKSGQKQEKTEWHRIVVWGKIAETCNQYLQKGRQVYIEGRIQTRQWQDKDGQTKYTTEVQAQNVQFLGSGAAAGERPSSGAQSGGREMGGSENYSGGGAPSPSYQQGGQSQEFGQGFGGAGSVQPATSSPMEPSFTEDDIPF